MLDRAKTSTDVEMIIELYEKDKATLTAMLVNIREIILSNPGDDQVALQKLKEYLKGQGIPV